MGGSQGGGRHVEGGQVCDLGAGATTADEDVTADARNKSLPQGVVTISASRRRLAGLGPNEMGLHRGNL